MRDADNSIGIVTCHHSAETAVIKIRGQLTVRDFIRPMIRHTLV